LPGKYTKHLLASSYFQSKIVGNCEIGDEGSDITQVINFNKCAKGGISRKIIEHRLCVLLFDNI
jgi:hypothetical protein